ncbi:MAG: hypothetical protein IJ315_07470, partial [Firmicutes bacterium]|nr:hypothetical protein [Bacillota bacterium]
MIRSFITHKIRHQEELSNLWQFDVPGHDSMKVAVPSCWETYPGFGSYRGQATYSRKINGAGNLRLVFEGVSHTADVSLDGVHIAHHYNAFTAFDAVVPAAQAGEHLLEVHVSNEFSEASSLHIENDYYSYGGISRPVAFEIVPDVFIEWIHMTPVLNDDQWSLKLEVSLRNVSQAAHTATVNTSLDLGAFTWENVTVPAGERTTVSGMVACPAAQAYSPENPVLYMVNTSLSLDGGEPCDDQIDRVGFREVKVSGKDILYNGKPIQIRGFCRHEDHPLFGCALPMTALDHDLNLFADIGANAVRTSHYPNDPLFLDLCDEKGLFVWEENHARGLTEENMRNPNFDQQCEDCINEMIRDHFNHPSIIMWGIMNECASETQYGRACYERQFAQIKKLDPSRPTTFASCKHYIDLCMDLPDIISYNIYPLWYINQSTNDYYNQLYDWVQTTPGAGKPFIISEIGAGAVYGYRSPNMDKWTEEYQEQLLT